jgi:hypothetical protein
MWIAHSEGWLSIVAHRDRPDDLLVRARDLRHINTMFPDAEVYKPKVSDYQFHAVISRTVVAQVLAERLGSIRYDKFKPSVREPRLAKAFYRIWELMDQYGLGFI